MNRRTSRGRPNRPTSCASMGTPGVLGLSSCPARLEGDADSTSRSDAGDLDRRDVVVHVLGPESDT